MVAAAVVGSAVVGAGASAVASSKASKAAKSTAAQNNALQQQIYSQNQATLAPFVSQGAPATAAINSLLGLNGATPGMQDAAFANFRNSDGYQFRLDEGNRALTASLSRAGMLGSGAAVKSALRYNQGQASNEFSNYYAALTGQQNLGATAASAQAGVASNYANAVSANNDSAGTARANAALSFGQGVNNALGSALSAYALSTGMKSSYPGGSITGPY